jgi:hypothetical protein
MPVVRTSKKGDDEGEAVSPIRTGAVTGEVSRIVTNLTLADHIGKFVAGEVTNQFQNENIADMLKGRNMIMISGSWG